MLEEMDAGQLAEWQAFDRLQAEEYKHAELESRAMAGLQSHKRGGR